MGAEAIVTKQRTIAIVESCIEAVNAATRACDERYASLLESCRTNEQHLAILSRNHVEELAETHAENLRCANERQALLNRVSLNTARLDATATRHADATADLDERLARFTDMTVWQRLRWLVRGA